MEEKALNLNGLQVHYKIAGSGLPILILHGWGRGSDSHGEVMERLAKEGYRVIVPDLPGFGKSAPPQVVWGVNAYVEFVNTFVGELSLQKFILLGHSFGGQIAVKFAVAYPEKVEKLILYAPAAIRREPRIKQKIVRIITKAGKAVLSFWPLSYFQPVLRKILYRMLGSSDYLYSQGIMKNVGERVRKEDLSQLFPQVKASTLIVWGDKDNTTPIEDAYILQEKIPQASLAVIPNAGHRIHQESPEEFINSITSFLRPQK